MNREPLAQWSLDVPDASFPAALAALGVLAALDRAALGDAYVAGQWRAAELAGVFARALDAEGGVLRWSLPTVSVRDGTPRIAVPGAGRKGAVANAPDATSLATAWRDFIAHLPAANTPVRPIPRLAVQSSASTRIERAMEIARLLARSEVDAAGVFVAAAFPSDGRADWRWPFTVATLPGDPLAEPLAALQRGAPLNWPFRFATATRDAPRFEVLVIGAAASEALARLLASGLRLRCCLVVVAGLGPDAPDTAAPLLRALAARVSAEGVAVVDPGGSTQDFAGRLNNFAYHLAHNATLDVALTQVFRPQLIALLGDDLLAVSRLDTAIDRVTERLRRLPSHAHVPLSPMAIENLRLERAAPPAPDPRFRGEATAGAEPPAPGAIADDIDAGRTNYRFDHESREASAVTELNRRVAEAEAATAPREATPRYVHQKSFVKTQGRLVEERGGYLVGQPVLVHVFIGPKRQGGIAAQSVFPERKLPANRDVHRLQVVFHEPRQFDQPMLGELLLPRAGDSSTAEFVFTPKIEGEFEARISILHRGRVLQTALLHTAVGSAGQPAAAPAGITLDDETRVRHDWSDLGRRRQFDLAFVLNHTAGGQPALTGVMGGKAWATRLDGIEQPVRRINELISAVAHSTADYADGLTEGENPALLVKLARVGANLYSLLYRDQLKQLATDQFDVGAESVTHVQVVSARQDAVVPLEFMYDFNAPDATASVCPQHARALAEGRCPPDCARAANPRGHVCPMGFWGLKKVVERHLFDPKAALPAGAEVVVQVEATEGRNRLDLSAGALVAHSKEVQATEVEALVAALTTQLGGNVTVVKDWDEWRTVVNDRHPAMLVAFPHNEGKEEDIVLEIGGKKLATLDLSSDYVHAKLFPAPLVFLLGCDVAGTAQEFSSHIRWFRQAGAAIVVSTIATVFGAHAVRVGEAIVARLLQSGTTGKALIGEIILEAKRDALLKSVPMALCVVAFGDADWKL